MRRAALTALAVALLAMPTAMAAAQSSSVFLFGSSAGRTARSVTDVPVTATGQLVVSFHGDGASGCAARGLCGYSGTDVVRPGQQGDLAIAKYGDGRRATYEVQLFLGGGQAGTLVAARVERSAGGKQVGQCADAELASISVSGNFDGGVVSLPLVQSTGSPLSTRCAGPIAGDLTDAGPLIELPLRQLIRGRMHVDLTGTRAFAADGLAGTVSSTVALDLGKPVVQSGGSTSFPPGIKATRVRQVSQSVSVTRANGTLSISVSGSSDPGLCQPLDSCLMHETLTATVRPHQATGYLLAFGPAARPYRDFLAALGAAPGGDPRGISVVGAVSWTSGGSISAKLGQIQSCTDSAPLGGGSVTFAGQAGGLSAAYRVADPPRTRCPGPILVTGATLASAFIGQRQLEHRTFVLRLGSRGLLDDDGYTGTTNTRLSLTLRRGTLTQQYLLAPTG